MADQCYQLGYQEVNLNLGCPSGTVTAKGKGSGMLKDTDALHRFLDQIFCHTTANISVKTRIGFDSPEEFPALMEIYNQYLGGDMNGLSESLIRKIRKSICHEMDYDTGEVLVPGSSKYEKYVSFISKYNKEYIAQKEKTDRSVSDIIPDIIAVSPKKVALKKELENVGKRIEKIKNDKGRSRQQS